MSGGPTIDGDGLVVGVNVSSAGNQLSFLVPAERVANLLAEYLDGQQDDTELLTIVARQFKALHEDLLGALLAQDLPTIRLGRSSYPRGLRGTSTAGQGASRVTTISTVAQSTTALLPTSYWLHRIWRFLRYRWRTS